VGVAFDLLRVCSRQTAKAFRVPRMVWIRTLAGGPLLSAERQYLNHEREDGDDQSRQRDIGAEEMAMHGEIPDRRKQN